MTSQIPMDMLEGWDIVLVDDEPDSLKVAEIILIEYGASVYTACDGNQGLRLVKAVKPRFVISDMSMPVMDGWGLISAIKADDAIAHTPVI
ncbi:MAG: response regulator, partial [Chloroflexota bacterium]